MLNMTVNLWRKINDTNQSALISELLPDIPANCEFEYSAPVVKEIELRLDGLLTPISEDLELPLVFIEAQMQGDADFYGRFFAGIFLYLRQYKIARPWRGLLILRRRSQDLGYNSPYQILLDAWVQRLYLENLIGKLGLKPCPSRAALYSNLTTNTANLILE